MTLSTNRGVHAEYLLKQYLQTNRTEPVYRTMYDEAMSGTKSNLIQQGVNQGLTYTKELVPRLDKNRKMCVRLSRPFNYLPATRC